MSTTIALFGLIINLVWADMIAPPAQTKVESLSASADQSTVLPNNCMFLIHDIKIGASPSIEKLYICAEKNRPAKKLVEYFKDIKVFRMKNPTDLQPALITEFKFEPHEFLIVPSRTGAMIIENILMGQKRKEVIRHEVFCKGLTCEVRAPLCLPRKKWTAKEISELRTNDLYKVSRDRINKLGCK